MARLTRKNIKVFAGNATNNGVFGSLQAENPVTTTNVEQIQSLPAWSVGWNSATMTSEKLPPLEEFQGIQYVTTYQQAYLMQEGMPEWASTVTYYKGSLTKEVTSNGFRIYCSLTDDNTNHLLSDTSNWKKVMDSSDLYAYDSAVVHIAGTETITGAKTFSTQIIASAGNGVRINGTNHYYVMRSGGSPYEGCSLLLDNDLTKKAFSAEASKITIGSSAIPAYANVPSGVTTSTSNEQIATTGWVNTVGNNVVHRTGNETIFGTKTFSNTIAGSINGNAATVTNGVYTTGNQTIGGTKTFTSSPVVSMNMPVMALQSTTAVKGTTPSSTIDEVVAFFDKNGTAQSNKLGQVFCSYTGGTGTVAGSIHVGLGVFKPQSGSTVTDYLSIYYPASGNPYATAPNSDVNGSILTTVNKSKASNGYFQLGNGLIVQWGFSDTSGTVTVRFPKAFTTTNYTIVGISYGATICVVDKTSKTTSTVSVGNTVGFDWIAIGY